MPGYVIKFKIGSYEFQEGSLVAFEPLKKPDLVLGLANELDKIGVPYNLFEVKIPIFRKAREITKEELKTIAEKKKK